MKMIGLARLGKDGDLRYTTEGKAVLTLNLAFSYGKDKDTQWVQAVMFGERAEKMQEYMKKGAQLYVTLNDPHVEEWETKEGEKKFTLKAILQDFEFAGSKKDAEQEAPASKPAPSAGNNSFDSFDDDPF